MKKLILALALMMSLTAGSRVASADIDIPYCDPCTAR